NGNDNEYRLKQNTYTNTARDLEYVVKIIIGNNRQYLKSNQRVILMGSSQGTYLLQRYLYITQDDEQVDGIILDSVLPTDITRLIHGDKYLNYILLDLFSRCSQDEEGCSKYFKDKNPMRALYTYKMNEDFQTNSSYVIHFLSKYDATFTALIYRINRCNFDDKNVLRHFINVTQPPNEDEAPGYSILVELNNNLAELWSPLNSQEKNPSCDYLQGSSMNTFVATHVMPDIYCPIQQQQILGYPTDQYYRKYPTKKTKLPVLLLHGDMDSALPVSIARHFSKQYSLINSNFTYIEMPRTGHTTTNAAPMTDEEGNCGWNLAVTYMFSPTFQPDRSCLNKISQIDFAGITTKSKQSAIQYFGTDNVWGTNEPHELTTSKPNELTTNKPNESTTNIAINIKYTLSIIISIFIIYLTSF
ncbi:unnamed protein product, partial [Rotaria sp. Silwood2]